jgi:hypothetical protein
MTPRAAVVMLVLATMVVAGCKKPSGSSAAAGTSGSTPPTAAPAATTDYRKLSTQQLEDLIREKTGNPVTLTADGPNKYKGTQPSPDRTAQLPVTVTVEAHQIVIETSGGGLSARDVIDAQGRLQSSDAR